MIDGRVPANWSMQVNWEPPCGAQTYVSRLGPGLTSAGYVWTCFVIMDIESANSSTHFILPGEVPSTLTSYGDFSTTYGEPQLSVFVGGGTPALVSTTSASTVVPGSSATFPFPHSRTGRR